MPKKTVIEKSIVRRVPIDLTVEPTTNGVKRETLTMNSLDEIMSITDPHRSAAQRLTRTDMARNLAGFCRNLGATELIRTEFLRFLLDGARDIDAECGYPAWLTPDHYRAMYDREGISKRVVNCEPEESWCLKPEIYEDEDPEEETEFEAAWKKLAKDKNLFHWMKRIDILSGIGQYGILLLGLDDGKDLMEPVDGVNDDGTFDENLKHKLTYLRTFSEEVVFVRIRETDITNPRYGLPKKYTIHFRDFPNWGIQAGEIIARDVHWSRVIHVADNRKISEIYGVPRMQPVWNRLYDIRKIASSSGEGFWKGAFPGMAFEVNPELADQGVEIDKEGVRKEMQNYMNGLQRYIAITGVTAKTLAPSVTDPSPHIESHLKQIAIAMAIPYRVLFGSEEAKLASGQDAKAWIKRVGARQSEYLTPMLIRPFVDRLIDLGVLPRPEEYHTDWPDLAAPSDLDKATVGLTRTQALAAYVSGGVSGLVPPEQYLTHILGMTSAEKDSIMDAAEEAGQQMADEETAGDNETEGENGEGLLGIAAKPDEGRAMEQKNLSRATTAPPGVKQANPTLVRQPDLNSEGGKRKLKANQKGKLSHHRNPADFNAKELARGMAEEKEHTDDEATAQEIAMDHLAEDPQYYRKLKKVGL